MNSELPWFLELLAGGPYLHTYKWTSQPEQLSPTCCFRILFTTSVAIARGRHFISQLEPTTCFDDPRQWSPLYKYDYSSGFLESWTNNIQQQPFLGTLSRLIIAYEGRLIQPRVDKALSYLGTSAGRSNADNETSWVIHEPCFLNGGNLFVVSTTWGKIKYQRGRGKNTGQQSTSVMGLWCYVRSKNGMAKQLTNTLINNEWCLILIWK